MQPGLIILDHWVKNGRGGQICREIKQHELLNHIPIILLSAVNELDEIARESCADHYLKKPFDLDSIIYVIEHYSKV
jgi:DNA-binding response OmpR family regulator